MQVCIHCGGKGAIAVGGSPAQPFGQALPTSGQVVSCPTCGGDGIQSGNGA